MEGLNNDFMEEGSAEELWSKSKLLTRRITIHTDHGERTGWCSSVKEDSLTLIRLKGGAYYYPKFEITYIKIHSSVIPQ